MIRWKKESMKGEKVRGGRPRRRGEGEKRAEFRNVRRGGRVYMKGQVEA